MSPTTEQITAALLRQWDLPEPGASKHGRGHVLVVGGARSTPGAVLLAGLSALRVGAGVLAMAVPEAVAIPLAVAVPESAVTGWQHADDEQLKDSLGQAGAVLVGPGLDDPDVATALVRTVAQAVPPDIPIVLDAYALGVLPKVDASPWAQRSVLTPNATEAGFLLDTDVDDDAEAEDVAAQIAQRWQCVVSYQGAVAEPGGTVRVVATGHAGLGTSGSGDVLAGSITGLLARGVEPSRAACWGTYLHAAAGDRLAARIGRLGFLARELLDEIPLVLTELQA